MAECPLPKPNTRVRFPSPAPIRKTYAPRRSFLLEQVTALRNRARNAPAANLRSKFAARLYSIEPWFRFPSFLVDFYRKY